MLNPEKVARQLLRLIDSEICIRDYSWVDLRVPELNTVIRYEFKRTGIRRGCVGTLPERSVSAEQLKSLGKPVNGRITVCL